MNLQHWIPGTPWRTDGNVTEIPILPFYSKDRELAFSHTISLSGGFSANSNFPLGYYRSGYAGLEYSDRNSEYEDEDYNYWYNFLHSESGNKLISCIFKPVDKDSTLVPTFNKTSRGYRAPIISSWRDTGTPFRLDYEVTLNGDANRLPVIYQHLI